LNLAEGPIMKRCYNVVDVFTHQPLLGNPVAVVLDAQDLTTDAMQAIAAWTNLSETTFVLPPSTPQADYRLRIFTPRSELPFAGHPTLGSAHALLEADRLAPRLGGRLIQECDVGFVELTIAGEGRERELSFDLPPAKLAPLSERHIADLELILGCKLSLDVVPAIVDVGPIWVVVHLNDASAVLDLRPDLARLAEFERLLGVTGVTAFGGHAHGEAAIEVRTFAPSCGVDEDPVCGSGNGSVAAFQWERGLLPPGGGDYLAAQGRCVGRDGRIKVSVDAKGKIRVGGSCVTCVAGSLTA
jgi:PhzF family phenazine biosynthesis protein